jgi:uncharacterized protein
MQQEEKVFWKNGMLTGEGLWRKTAGGDAGVVICHPHPLMGGSMHNNVVETIRDVFSSSGYSTLRFNFRGVGESTGRYDEGRGEKEDILSACEFIKGQGVEKITLAGYSFGAWVCCRLLKDKPLLIGSTILISPPQKYFDFDWDGLKNAVEFMICGDNDMFCDIDDLRNNADCIHSKLTILRATDHFYAGQEAHLAECLRQHIHEKKA